MSETLEIDLPDEEEIKIEAAPEGDAAAEAPKRIVEPAEGIEELRQKLTAAEADREREKSARQAAEQQARANAEAAQRSRSETQDTQVSLVANAIEQAKQNATILQGQYADAMQNGDYARVAALQMDMSKLAAQQMALENGLDQLKRAPPPQMQAPDPVEEMARNVAQSGAPKSAQWIRAHPEYARDPRLLRRMMAAANLAETDGLAVDSDAYFAHVEKTLGLRDEPLPGERPLPVEAAAPSGGRDVAPPAAPASRGANGRGSSPNRITLTPEQREVALGSKRPGETDLQAMQRYGQNLTTLIKEGRLN